MYEVTHLDPREDEEKIAEITEAYALGNFNDPPAGWRQVTEEEFVQKSMLRMYTPQYVEYKQIVEDKDKPYFERKPSIHCHLFLFHDGTGFAMEFKYWEGKVNYYMFGCQHDYVELSPQTCRERGITHYGNMWHVTECTKCGNIDSYDSSG